MFWKLNFRKFGELSEVVNGAWQYKAENLNICSSLAHVISNSLIPSKEKKVWEFSEHFIMENFN